MKIFLYILPTLWIASNCQHAYGQKITSARKAESPLDIVVKSGRFVTFNRTPHNINDDADSYFCEFKGEDYAHSAGVFGSNGIMYSAGPKSKDLALISEMDYRVLDENARFLTREECIVKAQEFKKILWPSPQFPNGKAAKPTIKDSKYHTFINWSFYEPTKLLRRSIGFEIRKVDGKCTTILSADNKWSSNRKSGLALSYKEALAAATKLLKSKPEKTNAILKSWTVEGDFSAYYQFNYELPNKVSLPIYVSAENGAAAFAGAQPSKPYFANDYVVSKFHSPRWTRQGLVFNSNQFRQSFDDESIGSKLMLLDSAGKYSVIYNVFNPGTSIVFASPSSDWLVLNDKGGTYALNLANGQAKVLGSEDRPCDYVSILDVNLESNQTGQQTTVSQKNTAPTEQALPMAAVIAAAGSEGRNRLFLDTLVRPFPMGLRERMEWDDIRVPYFSPDGKNVYLIFSTIDPATKKSGTSIRKMDTQKFLTAAQSENFNAMNETEQVHFTQRKINEIQFYPGGDLLFAPANNPEAPALIIDLKSHKEIALTTVAILKKNAARLASVSRIFAGSKNGEITILATTKKRLDAIFVCDMNGNVLKQLTPDHIIPVTYHRFSKQITGFEVSKQLALHQLEWELKQ